tara:strand:- start:879 stop:1523 length:645 start_codon:yes stop_codon:yes gene_type:complete
LRALDTCPPLCAAHHSLPLPHLDLPPTSLPLPSHFQQADFDLQLDALVIPGGESTTMGHLAQRLGMLDPLRAFVASGKPVMGTCAGLIFIADDVSGQKDGGQQLVGGMDITVCRNFYGSQVDSFETKLAPSFVKKGVTVPAVFIRAPGITRTGPSVEVLATCQMPGAGADAESVPVAVKQGALLAMAFHPELTSDGCWHEHFAAMVKKAAKKAS